VKLFDGKCILITGGTGSLGRALVRRLLGNDLGELKKIIVFSRDEAKQHYMRLEYLNKISATDEVIFHNFQQKLEFRIGDIRNFHSISMALRDVDLVVNTAALKQVPTCEYFPYEAVETNITGAQNIVRAIKEHNLPVEAVVGISTDKACKPVNVMGMTKAIQERIFINANIICPSTRFCVVRYGNVMASRGSVIPLFIDQIKSGGPVTLTTTDMTRFLLTIDEAVDTGLAAMSEGLPGETYIPKRPSALVIDVAKALISDRKMNIEVIGIRPGEKIHEILVSEEEAFRTIERNGWLVILPMLPELRTATYTAFLGTEYSSKNAVMSLEDTAALLRMRGLMPENFILTDSEILA
jgi:FlaA1/EpsC-like NDP-sugar epimerase